MKGFRGDDDGSVELVKERAVREKIEDLGGGEKHERIVHETGVSFRVGRVGGGVAGDVFRSMTMVNEETEMRIFTLKTLKFLWFHVKHCRGSAGQKGPMVKQEVCFKTFVHGMRMDGGAISGSGDAKGIEERGLFRGELIRVQVEGGAEIA